MKESSENPLIYLTKKLWKYSHGNRSKVITFSIFFIIASGIGALDPILVGYFLNLLQTEGIHQSNLISIFLVLGSFIVLELIFWAFHGVARVIETNNAFLVKNNYKKYLLKGVMDLPIEWHTDHHSGDTIDKIEKGTNALYNFSEGTFQVFQAVMRLVLSFGVLIYFNLTIALVVIGLTGITIFILYLFDKRLIPGYTVVNKLENSISAKVFDTLSNVTTVIILRIESLVLRSFDVFLQKPFKQFSTNATLNESKWFVASIMGRIIVVVVIGIYILTNLKTGFILVGTVYILYTYAERVRDTFFSFAYLYNDIVRYRTSVSNAEELSKLFITNKNTDEKHLPSNWKSLSIDNLSFSYHTEEGADLHIDNVSIQLNKGQRIALIGESGGGKSTVLKLIRDLYHPKTLDLTADGKLIESGFAGISDSISLVPQDPEIFATTIRENITVGVEYSDEHLRKFTDLANFTDVVGRLPHGLESSIVEKGVNLSGGEKQRLALVRGLLASDDKEIVLLDEPTSSVDMTNELTIYQNIFSVFSDKTIVSSIHRLHLLSLFDIIYFFQNGKIIASGTLDELKESSTDFQKLWEKYISARDNTIE